MDGSAAGPLACRRPSATVMTWRAWRLESFALIVVLRSSRCCSEVGFFRQFPTQFPQHPPTSETLQRPADRQVTTVTERGQSVTRDCAKGGTTASSASSPERDGTSNGAAFAGMAQPLH
ncbi:hypothetical protein D9M71_270930 [compost metagenome]